MLMPTICPTVTAYDLETYNQQVRLVASIAPRIHIDLMDGVFAPTVSPGLDEVWWPKHVVADVHLMYQRPMDCLADLVKLQPHMVIIHNEAEVHHMHFAAELHKEDIKVGLAVLHDTPIEWTEQIMHSFDQVLIFSGNLGHHGGEADLDLLHKVAYVADKHPEVEIAWDGGITRENVGKLSTSGVSVLNVGGGIHNDSNPQGAYDRLVEEAENNKT
jgi:ribulose-phosphate 3-epimerase